MKKLKLWNGRCYDVLPKNQWRKDGQTGHVFVAAYSVRDIQQLCDEHGLCKPTNYEVSVFWSAGCWGNTMEGITPERGIWLAYGPGKPERIA